jgi:hypothetical protein
MRLQVVADRAGSKHAGDSRNRGKGGHWRGPSQRRTVAGVEMRTFGEKEVATRVVARPCIHAGAGLGSPGAHADEGYAGGRLRHLTSTGAVGERPLELAARRDVELVEHLA